MIRSRRRAPRVVAVRPIDRQPQKEPEPAPSNRLGEAAVLSAVSAFAYATAFAYQAGYCGHFGIPLELVKLDVVAIIIAVAAVGAATWSIFLAAHPATSFHTGSVPRRIGHTIVVVCCIVPLTFWGGRRHQAALALGALGVGYLTRLWLNPLLFRRETTYVAKLAGADRDFPPVEHRTWLARNLSWNGLLTILLGAWLLTLAHVLGERSAKTKWLFDVRAGDPTLVVLRLYGDLAVTAPYDRGRRKLLGGLKILPVSDLGSLRQENLGALQMPPPR